MEKKLQFHFTSYKTKKKDTRDVYLNMFSCWDKHSQQYAHNSYIHNNMHSKVVWKVNARVRGRVSIHTFYEFLGVNWKYMSIICLSSEFLTRSGWFGLLFHNSVASLCNSFLEIFANKFYFFLPDASWVVIFLVFKNSDVLMVNFFSSARVFILIPTWTSVSFEVEIYSKIQKNVIQHVWPR